MLAHPDPSVKKRGILPEKFLDQYCNNNVNLMLLDVHSHQEIRNKNDPHYGKYNATFVFLDHDREHREEILESEESLRPFELRKHIKKNE